MNININTNSFKNKGYVLVENFLNKDSLKKIKHHSEDIITKSRKGQWPYVRVYNDYPHFFGKINIFGTDFPFNEKLSKEIYPLINEINISARIKEVTGWKNFKTSLVRLHSFQNFYNYQGMWHRDHDIYPSPNTVQSILYIKNEKGFRIVPIEKNNSLEKYGISSKYQTEGLTQKFANLPRDLYDTVDAKAGDLLIFESGLLHQGFCKSDRCHFIFRHDHDHDKGVCQSNTLNLEPELLPNYFLDKKIEKGKVYLKNNSISGKIYRFKSFLLYFLPRLKSIYRNMRINKKNKESIFYSTFFQ
tara:strand:+ start:152 stop:1057 length:906 start_codon:yes stop_codon:yes gene_type:complete